MALARIDELKEDEKDFTLITISGFSSAVFGSRAVLIDQHFYFVGSTSNFGGSLGAKAAFLGSTQDDYYGTSTWSFSSNSKDSEEEDDED